jgi:hypothetical protein
MTDGRCDDCERWNFDEKINNQTLCVRVCVCVCERGFEKITKSKTWEHIQLSMAEYAIPTMYKWWPKKNKTRHLKNVSG